MTERGPVATPSHRPHGEREKGDRLTFVVGDSELAKRIRAHAWEDTELGPPETWPESLKTLVTVMLSANQQMYVVWGPGRILLYNDRYIEVLQGHHPNALGRNFLEVWSEIADDLRPLVENAYAGIPTYQDDIKLFLERRGYTEETHFAYSYTPVLNADGGVDGFFCPCIETTAQVNAQRAIRESEAALRESEARHRLLIGSWAQAMWETDAEGVVVADSPSWRAYTGQRLEEWLGYGWLDAIHPDDRAYAERQWREAMAARSLVDAEYRLRASDGGWRWTNVRAAPVLDADGRIEKWAGMNLDIHARRQAEEALRLSDEHQRMLVAELQHRVRNTLGIVRSIARRTALNSGSVEELSAHLDGRLDAFARVQAMVTRRPEAGIDLAALIEDELVVHAAREGPGVTLEGPEVVLAARPAETLSLAIHELTTNAVKYGALSPADGHLMVRWALADGRFTFAWTESGVRDVPPAPTREGFGLELLRRVVPYELSAETRVEFRPDGLRFTLSMPAAGNIRSA